MYLNFLDGLFGFVETININDTTLKMIVSTMYTHISSVLGLQDTTMCHLI